MIDKTANDTQKSIGGELHQLARAGRLDLLEVCTPAGSTLSQQVIDDGGTAERIGMHNGYDLATSTGRRRFQMTHRRLKPRHLWTSPPCTAFSQMQRLNEDKPGCKEKLIKQRARARRIYITIRDAVREQQI